MEFFVSHLIYFTFLTLCVDVLCDLCSLSRLKVLIKFNKIFKCVTAAFIDIVMHNPPWSPTAHTRPGPGSPLPVHTRPRSALPAQEAAPALPARCCHQAPGFASCTCARVPVTSAAGLVPLGSVAQQGGTAHEHEVPHWTDSSRSSILPCETGPRPLAAASCEVFALGFPDYSGRNQAELRVRLPRKSPTRGTRRVDEGSSSLRTNFRRRKVNVLS